MRLELKERPDTGVYVKDLSAFVAKSVKEIEHVMNVGNQNRKVGRTDMNEHSSRSHAVFVLTVECAEVRADLQTMFHLIVLYTLCGYVDWVGWSGWQGPHSCWEA